MGLFKKGFRNLEKKGYRRSSKSIRIKVILLVTIILAIFLILINIKYFNIKKYDILMDGVNCASENQIEDSLNFKGQNIFFYNTSFFAKKIQDKFLCISKIKIDKNYPDSLKVSLEERKSAAILNLISFSKQQPDVILETATPSSQAAVPIFSEFDFDGSTQSGKYLADSNGFVFSEANASPKNLLTIDLVNFDVKLGRRVPGDLINNVQNIVNDLKKNSIAIDNIKVLDKKILVYSKPNIIFSTDKDIGRQVASLQLILQKARIDSRPIESIDLTFDKPVLVYSPKK